MEDNNLVKFRQVSEIFKEKFQSPTIQQHNQAYLNHLYENLNHWKSDINEIIKQIIREKTEEINQFYNQYYQEMNEKYAKINQQIENENSLANINNQIENFNINCQSNTIENCIRLHTTLISKDQLAETIKLEYILHPDPPSQRTIEPSKSIINERTEPIPSTRTSPVPVPIDRTPKQYHSNKVIQKDTLVLKPSTDPSREEPFIPYPKPKRTTRNDNIPKSSTRLYIGKHNTLTPVLVDKNREVYNETEKITEYSIDSISISPDKQDQSSNLNIDNDNEITLVRAYKVLIKQENDYQQLSSSTSSSSSDHEEEEEQSNVENKFNLKNFNQINYSTIMFRKFSTEFNCIASSTRRNELILYNSKLKVLIILQHEISQQCRQRFYLQWPEHLSPNLSDITYCRNNDQFLISTWDSSHIYIFNRGLSSMSELGKLANGLPLRRIHSYQQTIYCILSNNYLVEYQLDEHYSKLTIIRKIKLFDPTTHSQDTVYHLLDITCDDNYLIIIYANEHDEIRLQSIHRQTREFHQDFLLDNRQPINQNYIRIESTNSNGTFLYLNGSLQHLKVIHLGHSNKGKITSIMRRHSKPTNICLLKDERLVILYEHPYFLSVHDLNDQQEMN